MTATVTPHLNFRGTARQALEHYQSVFGGHLVAVTYADLPAAAPDVSPDESDLVVWGQVVGEGGFRVMAFDVPAARPHSPGEHAYYVSVRVNEADELTGYWERLVVGSSVITPFGPSSFSPLYGMLTDRFGVTWVMDLEVPYAG